MDSQYFGSALKYHPVAQPHLQRNKGSPERGRDWSKATQTGWRPALLTPNLVMLPHVSGLGRKRISTNSAKMTFLRTFPESDADHTNGFMGRQGTRLEARKRHHLRPSPG